MSLGSPDQAGTLRGARLVAYEEGHDMEATYCTGERCTTERLEARCDRLARCMHRTFYVVRQSDARYRLTSQPLITFGDVITYTREGEPWTD